MRFCNLPIKYQDNVYYFNKLLGVLLYSNDYTNMNINETSELVNTNHKLVLNPYLMGSCNKILENQKVPLLAKVFANLIVFTSKYSFYLACILIKIPLIKFSSSQYAVEIFNKIYSDPLQQRTLCLSRTIFVIATSKSFKNNGTAFIGVFLPSRKMHAWVIESGCNPDSSDEIWLSYQPVVAIIK